MDTVIYIKEYSGPCACACSWLIHVGSPLRRCRRPRPRPAVMTHGSDTPTRAAPMLKASSQPPPPAVALHGFPAPLTCSSPPPHARTTAAKLPKSLQATNTVKSFSSDAERVARDLDDGTVKLAEPLPLPPRRCRLPMALKAAHTTLDGSCGMLRATGGIQCRCTLLPCRLACKRTSYERRHSRCRPCRCGFDKASPCLMPRQLKQRATAALPLPTAPLTAAVHRPLRSAVSMHAQSHRTPLPTAAQHVALVVQCPCSRLSSCSRRRARARCCSEATPARSCCHAPRRWPSHSLRSRLQASKAAIAMYATCAVSTSKHDEDGPLGSRVQNMRFRRRCGRCYC